MFLKVVYFASLREQLGLTEEQVVLEAGSTIADLLQLLIAKHGELGEKVFKERQVLSALNQEMCDPSQTISEGDEVAFFPPVTGG